MSDLVKVRALTPARVGLARAGAAIGVKDHLQFQLDHAAARDAVHARLNVPGMLNDLRRRGLEAVALRSAVQPGEAERREYLHRPDLGRRLAAESVEALRDWTRHGWEKPDVVFVVADGLSAVAVERHALHVLGATRRRIDANEWRLGPVCVVSQGRVAVADEVGELLDAKAVVMLIGERPGLSAAHSLGIYVTWQPRVGRTDAERNCISNVRLEGLSYDDAGERIVGLLHQARLLGATGVGLKDVALTDGSHAMVGAKKLR